MKRWTVTTVDGFFVAVGDAFYTDDDGNLVTVMGDTVTSITHADAWEGITPYRGDLARPRQEEVVEQSVAAVVQPVERSDQPEVEDTLYLDQPLADPSDVRIDVVPALLESGALPIVPERVETGFEPVTLPGQAPAEAPPAHGRSSGRSKRG